MLKKQRKCIMKEANKWNPWDYCYTLFLLEASLKGMYEYYADGSNVKAEEIEGHNRSEKIALALRLLNNFYETHDMKELQIFFNFLGKEMLYWWD